MALIESNQVQSCDLRFVSVRQWRDLCTGREMNKRAIVPVAPAGITLELLKHSWMKLTWYCTHSDWVLFLFFLTGGGVVWESATGYSFMHSAILFQDSGRSQRRFAHTDVKGTANHLCFAHLFNGYINPIDMDGPQIQRKQLDQRFFKGPN